MKTIPDRYTFKQEFIDLLVNILEKKEYKVIYFVI